VACCATLCCAAPCCTALRYAALCCAVPCCPNQTSHRSQAHMARPGTPRKLPTSAPQIPQNPSNPLKSPRNPWNPLYNLDSTPGNGFESLASPPIPPFPCFRPRLWLSSSLRNPAPSCAAPDALACAWFLLSPPLSSCLAARTLGEGRAWLVAQRWGAHQSQNFHSTVNFTHFPFAESLDFKCIIS